MDDDDYDKENMRSYLLLRMAMMVEMLVMVLLMMMTPKKCSMNIIITVRYLSVQSVIDQVFFLPRVYAYILTYLRILVFSTVVVL